MQTATNALQAADRPNAAVPATGGVLADFLTPYELAEQLHISPRTLTRWHARRQGPARLIIGRKPYYRRAAVEKWLASRERGFEDDQPARRRRA